MEETLEIRLKESTFQVCSSGWPFIKMESLVDASDAYTTNSGSSCDIKKESLTSSSPSQHVHQQQSMVQPTYSTASQASQSLIFCPILIECSGLLVIKMVFFHLIS